MGTSSYTNLLNQKSKKFFTDLSSINSSEGMQNNELSEKIQLKISINQIDENCQYKVKLYSIKNKQKILLNEFFDCSSEDNKTSNLKTPIIICYYFEKDQPLYFETIRENSGMTIQYETKTTLACIMGSRKKTFERNIFSEGKEILIVKGEKLGQNEEVINIKFEIIPKKKISFREIKSKMYYEVYSDNNILYSSECLNDRGIFNPVKIPVGLFKDNKINIIIYKSNRKKRGNFNTTIFDFTKGMSIQIRVNGVYFEIKSKSNLTKNYSFVDYLKAGMQIGLSIAIDFTGSNGNPSDINSLHYINGPEPNQYERAINTCGNIVGFYDYDQLYPCYGFGAKINNMPCQKFNLNFENDPNIKYINGIIEAYHKAINLVTLYGPTYFGPVIKETIKMIKNENNNSKYHILMILTDGIIDDIDETIEELVEGSFLPLSVIIIGVGKADFSNMEVLDADDNPLVNGKGVQAARDLVQFVPFLKYESDPEKLANEVLAEIPRQIIEYYEQNNLDPLNLASSLNIN